VSATLAPGLLKPARSRLALSYCYELHYGSAGGDPELGTGSSAPDCPSGFERRFETALREQVWGRHPTQ